MFKKLNLQVKISAVILIPFLLMIIVSGAINVKSVSTITKDLSYKVLEQSSTGEATILQFFLREELLYTTGLQYDVETLYNDGTRTRTVYENMINNFLDKMRPNVCGMSITFLPNYVGDDINYINDPKYSAANGQFSYYVARSGNQKESRGFTSQELTEDYITKPLSTGKPYITPIYEYLLFGTKKKQIFSWCVPIRNNGNVIGVITTDILVSSINSLVANIQPFEGAEASLFDSDGNILYDAQDTNNVTKKLYAAYDYYKQYNVLDVINKGTATNFSAYSEKLKKNVTYTFVPLELTSGQYWGLKLLVPNNVIFRESNNIRNRIIIISLIIMIVAFLITPLIIKKKVSNVIYLLAQDMVKLSNGDISWSPPKQFLALTDEWGIIANGIQTTLDNLNKIVHTVKNSADHVSTAANEVLSGNNDLASRTEMQASSLEETASSMNEIASNINESADGVLKSSQMVMEAKQYINKVGNIVKESVIKMNDVNEASGKIMDITKLIENIAFQTNILALNASVEAARAGEQGRGFAVVASEVRNLAQNAQESVKNITNLINDSNDKVTLATESVKESQSIFIELEEKMDKAADIMQKINNASQEQKRGVEQINLAIMEMDSSVQKNAALVEEATAASQSLLDESKDLIDSIEYFKLREEE